jgi:hypothetical protein
MNRMITALLVAGLMGTGMQAFADDTATPPANGEHQMMRKMMKECMAKAKAANNGMSKKDMRKSCHDQIKSKLDHPGDTSPPATPAQ